MRKVTAKECRQVARVLLKDWRYWQSCRTDFQVRVVREYYKWWGETHMTAHASIAEYRADYLDETWAWFDNPAAARRFCIRHLGLPSVEQAKKGLYMRPPVLIDQESLDKRIQKIHEETEKAFRDYFKEN